MIKANELRKYIENSIKHCRKMHKMSQEQLTENIDIAPNSIISIETGNSFMPIYTMEKLLNTLNISPKELYDFGEIVQPNANQPEFIKSSIEDISENKDKLAILYSIVRFIN